MRPRVLRSSRKSSQELLHFRIGVIGVSLDSPIERFRQDYLKLYQRYQISEPDEKALALRIRRHWKPWWKEARYEIRGDEEGVLFATSEQEVLPHLEWALNWHIALYHTQFLQIHASLVQLNRKTILFPASPGSGKTTLSAGLVILGADYFSDEFALIDPKTLLVYPYPKAFCVKEGSIPILQTFCPGLRLDSRWIKKRKGPVAFLDPWLIRESPIATPGQIDYVVFLNYLPQAQPRLTPISKAEAAFNLNKHSLNFLNFRERGIEMLASIVEAADCYRLQAGELGPTCELMSQLVRNGRP
jgi:HprK-related kinase A